MIFQQIYVVKDFLFFCEADCREGELIKHDNQRLAKFAQSGAGLNQLFGERRVGEI
ncbi:hypothetical protein D3C71_1950310 [compost metagenome]